MVTTNMCREIFEDGVSRRGEAGSTGTGYDVQHQHVLGVLFFRKDDSICSMNGNVLVCVGNQ